MMIKSANGPQAFYQLLYVSFPSTNSASSGLTGAAKHFKVLGVLVQTFPCLLGTLLRFFPPNR